MKKLWSVPIHPRPFGEVSKWLVSEFSSESFEDVEELFSSGLRRWGPVEIRPKMSWVETKAPESSCYLYLWTDKDPNQEDV